jgi:mannose-6-phosphate isomerase-like protein (cupin superfamily)/DNA-binding XRE family transcriptional regulator
MSAGFDPGTGLGPRLRLAREERQLSVRELARRIGCSASLISQIERGVSVPSVGVLYSLAAELDSSLDHLLFGAEQRPPAQEPAVTAVTKPSPGEHAGGGPGLVPVLGGPGLVPVLGGPGLAPVLGGPGLAPVLGGPGLAPVLGGPGIVQRAGCRSIIDLASGVRWERLTPGADAMTDFLEVVYAPGGHSTDERRPLRHDGREYGLVISGTLQANVGFERYELGPGDSIAFDSSTPHEYLNKTGEPVHAVWVVVHSEPGRA